MPGDLLVAVIAATFGDGPRPLGEPAGPAGFEEGLARGGDRLADRVKRAVRHAARPLWSGAAPQPGAMERACRQVERLPGLGNRVADVDAAVLGWLRRNASIPAALRLRPGMPPRIPPDRRALAGPRCAPLIVRVVAFAPAPVRAAPGAVEAVAARLATAGLDAWWLWQTGGHRHLAASLRGAVYLALGHPERMAEARAARAPIDWTVRPSKRWRRKSEKDAWRAATAGDAPPESV